MCVTDELHQWQVRSVGIAEAFDLYTRINLTRHRFQDDIDITTTYVFCSVLKSKANARGEVDVHSQVCFQNMKFYDRAIV